MEPRWAPLDDVNPRAFSPELDMALERVGKELRLRLYSRRPLKARIGYEKAPGTHRGLFASGLYGESSGRAARRRP